MTWKMPTTAEGLSQAIVHCQHWRDVWYAVEVGRANTSRQRRYLRRAYERNEAKIRRLLTAHANLTMKTTKG